MSHEEIEELGKPKIHESKKQEPLVEESDDYDSDFSGVDEVIEVGENGSIKRFSRPQTKKLHIEIPLAEEEPSEDERPLTPDSAYGDGSIYRGLIRPGSPSKSQYGKEPLLLKSPDSDNEFDWIPRALPRENKETKEKMPPFQRKQKEEERLWIGEGTFRREDLEKMGMPPEFWEELKIQKSRIIGIKIADCWKLLKSAHKKILAPLKEKEARLWADQLKKNAPFVEKIMERFQTQEIPRNLHQSKKASSSSSKPLPSDKIKPPKILNTDPDGNCLIHAIYGSNQSNVIVCPNAQERREELGLQIQKLAQKNPHGISLKSFAEENILFEAQESAQAIRQFAQSMGANTQYLGLEHADLIAKIKKLNILVYNETSRTWVELFYKEPRSKEPDHIISLDAGSYIFQGAIIQYGHWSKCEKPQDASSKKSSENIRVSNNKTKQTPSLKGKPKKEVLEILDAHPQKLLDIVNTDRDTFLALIKEGPDRNALKASKERQEKRLAEQEEQLNQFALSDTVYKQYLNTIMHPNFWFEIQEIHLAALLFDKKVQVVYKPGQNIVPFTDVINAQLPSERIVIYHEGNHFSRCIPTAAIGYANAMRVMHSPQPRKSYNERLNKLIENYGEFLTKHINGEDFDPRSLNPFKDDIFQAKVLLPLNGSHLLPLAFPQQLIIAIENQLSLRDIVGIPVPYYSFGLNPQKTCYELSIEYRVFQAEKGDPEEYCRFVIAEIGRDTVDAFQEERVPYKWPLSKERSLFFHNEFLIQAMYTHLSNGLGLPGKESFRLLKTQANTVIPIEQPFKGLFQLLNVKKPQKTLVHYESMIQSPLLSFFGNRLEFSPKEHYRAVEEKRQTNKDIQVNKLKKGHIYKEAKNSYFLVEALLKLTANESVLDNFRRIHHPDTLVECPEVLQNHPEQETDEERTQRFINAVIEGNSLQQNQSTERKRLESHLKHLQLIRHIAASENEEKESIEQLAGLLDGNSFSDYEP